MKLVNETGYFCGMTLSDESTCACVHGATWGQGTMIHAGHYRHLLDIMCDNVDSSIVNSLVVRCINICSDLHSLICTSDSFCKFSSWLHQVSVRSKYQHLMFVLMRPSQTGAEIESRFSGNRTNNRGDWARACIRRETLFILRLC